MRATHSWIDSRRGPITASAILLLITLVACLYAKPIVSGDTDLWYHLTSGHHLFETGSPYKPYINSFIDPLRTFTNLLLGIPAAGVADLQGFRYATPAV